MYPCVRARCIIHPCCTQSAHAPEVVAALTAAVDGAHGAPPLVLHCVSSGGAGSGVAAAGAAAYGLRTAVQLSDPAWLSALCAGVHSDALLQKVGEACARAETAHDHARTGANEQSKTNASRAVCSDLTEPAGRRCPKCRAATAVGSRTPQRPCVCRARLGCSWALAPRVPQSERGRRRRRIRQLRARAVRAAALCARAHRT